MTTLPKNVEDLAVGNRVDLSSCPYLKDNPSLHGLYGVVEHVERETPHCVVIGYEGIDHVGYPPGTILQVRTPRDVAAPSVQVQSVADPRSRSEWRISQNLTDRWGELNYHNHDNKPLDLLEDDHALLERLLGQMWDEATFVVRKDGKFGILFESEYCSRESEAHAERSDPVWYATLKPYDEVAAALLNGMAALAKRFPGVEFAVPDPSEVVDGRPAAWAFVADGLLNDKQRENLGVALGFLLGFQSIG